SDRRALPAASRNVSGGQHASETRGGTDCVCHSACVSASCVLCMRVLCICFIRCGRRQRRICVLLWSVPQPEHLHVLCLHVELDVCVQRRWLHVLLHGITSGEGSGAAGTATAHGGTLAQPHRILSVLADG